MIRTASLLIGCALILVPQLAFARPKRPDQLPNGNISGCANCHVSPGGGGARNAFGAVVLNSFLSAPGSDGDVVWGPTLAQQDADGDGFTNGQELQDPNGAWQAGQSPPGDPLLVTNPGDPNNKPQAQPEPEPVPQPDISVSTTRLNFGSVVKVGSRGEQTFQITNAGKADLIITGISAPDESYLISLTEATVLPAQSIDITVTFAPQSEGTHNTTLTIASNAPDQLQTTVDLTASAQPPPPSPALDLLPASLNFGDTLRVNDRTEQIIRITNPGNADLIISSIIASDTAFTLSPMQATITPADTVFLTVIFSPQIAGDHNAQLTFATNLADHPDTTITITATAQPLPPALSLSTNTLIFGDVRLDTTHTDTLRLENTGGTELVLSFTSPDPAFTFSADTLAIASGQATSLSITFAPPDTLQYNATLLLHTNIPTMLTVEITLEGQGRAVRLIGDFDDSGTVDFSDFLIFAQAFGTTESAQDLNSNGTVDFPDFLIFARAFGSIQ